MKEIDNLINYPIVKVLEYYKLEVRDSDKDRIQTLCPFHGDTAPSMLINVDKNFAFCFSCNKGWDSVEFIRKKENIGFFDALKKLSEIAGLNYDTATLRYIYYQHPASFKEKEIHRLDKKVDVLVLDLLVEFLRYCHQWPALVKRFYYYMDVCLLDYDTIVDAGFSDTVMLDKTKDWLYRSKKFIHHLVPIFRNYEKMKREVYQEKTEENLGT